MTPSAATQEPSPEPAGTPGQDASGESAVSSSVSSSSQPSEGPAAPEEAADPEEGEDLQGAGETPAAPVLSGLKNVSGGVRLTWEPDGQADSYVIYRKTSKKAAWKKYKTAVPQEAAGEGTAPSGAVVFEACTENGTPLCAFCDTSVKSGTLYFYTVQAVHGTKAGEYDQAGKSIRYMAVPDLYKITKPAAGYKLYWKKVPGAVSYIIYRRVESSTSWKRAATVKKGDTVTYVDKKAAPYHLYHYRIVACGKGGSKSAADPEGRPTSVSWVNASASESGTANMCYTWWTWPQIVSAGGKTFFGYVSSNGVVGVAARDAAGEIIRTPLHHTVTDDHNSCSVSLMDDGRIMAVYADGHNLDKHIFIRISEAPGDVRTFSAPIVLTSSAVTTYAQVFHTNGKYYIFFRSGNRSWRYFMSTDGKTWSRERTFLLGGMQYYCKFMTTDDPAQLQVAMISNPRAADHNIRTAVIDLSTGLVYAPGRKQVLGRMSASLPRTTIPVCVRPADSQLLRLFDVAKTSPAEQVFAYCAWHQDSSVATYYVYRDGRKIPLLSSEKYWITAFGGVSFLNKDELLVSYGRSGRDHLIRMRYDASKGTYRIAGELDGSDYSAESFRTIRPAASPDGSVFMYQQGWYNPEDFTSFRTGILLG